MELSQKDPNVDGKTELIDMEISHDFTAFSVGKKCESAAN
jgi:hypothetical protein